MNRLEPLRRSGRSIFLAGFFIAGLVFASAAAAQQPITYQGQLKQSGTPFTGMADLEFRLYDSLVGGTQVGSPIARNDWPVEEGLFQVELDFGGGSFGADPRWLQITVDGSTLLPRQRVHAAPMAMFALAGNEGPPGPEGPQGPPGDSHWIINGTATAYLDGPVGIGTDMPAATLDVRGNSSIAIPQAYLVEQEDDFARLSFGNTVSDRFWSLAGLTRGDNVAFDRFNLFHSTGGNLLQVNGAGSIGIGGNPPLSTYRLSVGEGLLVTRDTGASSGTIAHLALGESSGPEPVRQLFWNSAASRGWRIDSFVDADPANERWTLSTTGTGINATVLSALGSGAVGIGYLAPPAALTVRSRGAWTWDSGNGRGDFYIGDSLVGLSMGVALGGGGRGVSRIWTNGGVEHLFIGSAGYGASMSILPGQVGINTTAPTATLDVDGGARIRGLGHADAIPRNVHADEQGNFSTAARESFLAIPSTAFAPGRGATNAYTGFPIGFFIDSASGFDAFAFAPVTALPHGAMVTGLNLWFYDNSIEDLAVLLIACPHTASDPLAFDTECTQIARVDSTGQNTTPTRTAAAISVLDVRIDHELNAYHVVAATGTWNSNLILRSVRLSFEY